MRTETRRGLLHYKYIGFERTYLRHRELYTGLRLTDIKNRWGHRYSWSVGEFARDWNTFLDRAIDFRKVPAESYPIKRWWSTLSAVRVSSGAGDGAVSPDASVCEARPPETGRKDGRRDCSDNQQLLSKTAFEAAITEHDLGVARTLAVIDAEIDCLEREHQGTPHPHDLPRTIAKLRLHQSNARICCWS